MTTITAYDKFIENFGKKLIDFSVDTFKILLVTSSYTFDSTDEDRSDIAGELLEGNGYLTGGAAIAGLTWGFLDGATILDGDNVVWTASGGAIGPVTGAVLYDDTSIGKKLICYIDFGGAQTVPDGSDLKVTFNASGIVSFAQA